MAVYPFGVDARSPRVRIEARDVHTRVLDDRKEENMLLKCTVRTVYLTVSPLFEGNFDSKPEWSGKTSEKPRAR